MARDTKDRMGEKPADMQRMALTISVSLFMSILAFFIVLNSFSANSATKLASVRDSLLNTFGFVGQGLSINPTNEEGKGTAGDMEQAAAAGLRSVLPDLGFQTRSGVGGTVMAAVIPREDFQERWPALRSRLGDLMVNRDARGRFILQLVALDGQAENLLPFAAELHDEGVDTDKIAVGFENRGQNAIELRFVQESQ